MSRENEIFICKSCESEVAPDDIKRCELCLRRRCSNCVIEIADKTVCEGCKDFALKRLRSGKGLVPKWKVFTGNLFRKKQEIPYGYDDKLSPDWELVTSRKLDVDGSEELNLSSVFFLALFLVPMVLATILLKIIVLPFLYSGLVIAEVLSIIKKIRNIKDLNFIEVTRDGFSAYFKRKGQKSFKWEQVLRLFGRRNRETGDTASITLYTANDAVTIDNTFTSFRKLTEAIIQMCHEHKIKIDGLEGIEGETAGE